MNHEIINQLKQKTVLIDGANGLIGSCLCKTLDQFNTEFQAEITILALVRSAEKAKTLEEQIQQKSWFHVLEGDIQKPLPWEKPVDYLIHTASPTDGKFFIEHPVETIDTIVNGTKNMLMNAGGASLKSAVYVSSMEVYGQVTEEKLLKETDLGELDITNLRNTYPLGKRMAEQLCIAMYREYQVPVKIIRLAQTFGPGISRNENRVYAQFLRSSVKGEDIIMHTEGKSKRMYLDSEDAARAILFVLLKGESGEIYNAANESTYCSIREMAELTAESFSGGKSRVIVETSLNTGQYPPDNMLKLDVSRLEALGWKPEHGLKEMFQRIQKELF